MYFKTRILYQNRELAWRPRFHTTSSPHHRTASSPDAVDARAVRDIRRPGHDGRVVNEIDRRARDNLLQQVADSSSSASSTMSPARLLHTRLLRRRDMLTTVEAFGRGLAPAPHVQRAISAKISQSLPSELSQILRQLKSPSAPSPARWQCACCPSSHRV